MKNIFLEQGSLEWLAWRKNHIGASDVPVILKESDFSTPYELWQVKTGRREGFQGNWATERGRKAEPEIRRLYEELYNVKLTQPVAVYDHWPVLSASFDGYSEEMKLIAEFKYPSEAKHALAVKGFVPPTYVSQVQAQMLVAGVDTCHYVSYNGKEIAVVVVKADKQKQEEILEKCKEFWSFVENDSQPEGSPAKPTSHTLEILAKRYKELLHISSNLKEEMEMIKNRISDIIPDNKAEFYGLSLSRSTRAGAVNYAAIPELAGVDLEQYRKSPVETLTIREIE